MDLQYYTMGKNFNTLRTNEGILPVRLNISDIQQLHDIDEIQIKNLRDQNLPLRLLGELSKRTTYESISHKNGQRVVYVDIADTRYSISQLSSLVENVLKDLQLKDVHYSLGGQKSSLDIFLNEFKVIMLVAIILVYMLLSAQFESLLSPFVIFTTVPVSVIALALVMIVFDYDLNLSVMIGTLTLAGVVVNNAIVMVTFLHQKITTGNYKQIRRVIVESASLRLRPILMTTLTTVIALIPVAISNAEGSEFESPIAWTIIFGLLITTMFTLLVLPAIAEIFEKRRFRPH
jgi:HAE1 family hydrophobic/amphiphilic exporter-1